MGDYLQTVIILMLALLMSLTVHEYAHAWVATKLGDATPVRQGRLTLSPLPHIDPIGTIALPLLLLLSPLLAGGGQPIFFGWAKPVQFSPVNFTRKVSMWQGTALAASAGPASNLFLALLAAIALKLVTVLTAVPPMGVIDFVVQFFRLNVLLAVFNLVPLPPLDGGHLIPRSLAQVKDVLTRYSFILFFLLFLVPVPGIGGTLAFLVIGPVTEALQRGLFFVVGLS